MIMKRTKYLAPQSELIEVAAECVVCGSPAGTMSQNVSNPFSGNAVPDEEDEW